MNVDVPYYESVCPLESDVKHIVSLRAKIRLPDISALDPGKSDNELVHELFPFVESALEHWKTPAGSKVDHDWQAALQDVDILCAVECLPPLDDPSEVLTDVAVQMRYAGERLLTGRQVLHEYGFFVIADITGYLVSAIRRNLHEAFPGA